MAGADLSELEALYRSRYRFFLRVAWLIAGGEEDAREAVQEGFASVLRARESFRGEGSLEGWVWRSGSRER